MIPNKRKILGATIVIGLFLSCAEKSDYHVPEDQILAKVGDRYITADEFKYSFEFSPAPLRGGVKPRKTYLDYMIKELLMANEGYRLGLHKTTYVQSRMKQRQYDNLLESFYLKHVHDNVNLEEDDIREAVQKSTVKWRMIIWPTPSLEEAQNAYAKASQSSLSDYVDQQLAQQEIKRVEREQFETDWLDYLEFRPEVLEKIVDVEMGKPTEPFPYGDGFAIAQVLDIHREGNTEDELKLGPRRQKIKERLHNIESDRIVHELMDSLITPLDVRVRGPVVEDLISPLYEWVQRGLPDHRSLFQELEATPDSARLYLEKISQMLDEDLVSYSQGIKRVRDFLHYVDYHRSVFHQSVSVEDFQNRVITEIGRMMKNDLFVDIAKEEGFLDSLAIKQDLRLWEQKWTFDIYRNQSLLDIKVTEKEMRAYFKNRWRELGIADVDTMRFYKYRDAVHNAILYEKQIAQLESDLERLRSRYDVWINEDLLRSIELVDDRLINRTSYFVRKNFNFQAVSPIVDMKWVTL